LVDCLLAVESSVYPRVKVCYFGKGELDDHFKRVDVEGFVVNDEDAAFVFFFVNYIQDFVGYLNFMLELLNGWQRRK